MRARINRRRLFGLLMGAVTSLTNFGATSATVEPRETIVCWYEGDPYCLNGVMYQRQCCKDCSGEICLDLGCSEVVIGTC